MESKRKPAEAERSAAEAERSVAEAERGLERSAAEHVHSEHDPTTR